jgi:HK97 family phage prohead protease
MIYRFAEIQAGDGMTFTGVAVPFGAVVTIRGEGKPYDETFRRGAFAKTLMGRNKPVQLREMHQHQMMPLGAAEQLDETDEGLLGTWRLSDTERGREAATLVHDRVLTGLSIGFEPIHRNLTEGGKRPSGRDLVERTEVRLYEVSLVNDPAYESAGVTASRNLGGRPLSELVLARQALTVDRFGRIAR